MQTSDWYRLSADALLVAHVLFVLFVVGGLLLIYIGRFRAWTWVRNVRFRVLHLLAVAVVVLQSWFGLICPLTTWELALRAKAGDAIFEGSFISHWLQTLLYIEAPFWVFVLAYTVFGALVLGSWFVVRPRSRDDHGRLGDER